MKILFVCAGGLSTSILMKKLNRYASENGGDITVEAVGISEVKDVWEKYNCILIAPQVRNHLTDIKEMVKIPAGAIAPQDYAMGNVENIIKLAESLAVTQNLIGVGGASAFIE